jgi:HEAT repeat protein
MRSLLFLTRFLPATRIASVGLAILIALTSTVQADDVQQLLKDFNSSDQLVRIQALDGIAELGASGADAVPALIKLLDDSDEVIVWHAARTLGAVGDSAATAVPQLTAKLGDERPKVRAYSAFALGRIGKPALSAVDTLVELAFDDDAVVRRSALRALRQIDPPQEKTMPMVIKILEQGDMSIIIPALQSIAEEGKDAVPRLRRALKHEKAQYWACVVLADIGPDSAEAVPELINVLKAKDPDVRLEALVALGAIGDAAKPAIPAIVALAEGDDYKHVRYAAIYALGQLGGNGAATKSLRNGMKSDDEFLRTICSWAAARTSPNDKELVAEAIGLIVDSFQSEDVHVRRAAARAMVEFDADREVVAPLLVKALADKDQTVVANAIEALASLGPQALAHVDDALANKELRHYAVRLIARLGREGEVAVPALVEVLSQQTDSPDDVEFIREAQFALGTIGPAAKDAIPVLVKALSADDESVAASAAYALGKIGAAARSAVPGLQRSEGNKSVIVKAASVFALWQIQPGNPARRIKATSLLLRALDDERELVRAGAATMLGDLGAVGARASKRLTEVSEKDESDIVRQAAGEALKKMAG